MKWVQDPVIRRAFAVTVRVILIRLGITGAEIEKLNDPEEVETMLAPNLMEWRDRVREEGREDGRKEGREDGRKEGLEKGQLAGEALILARQLQLKFGPLDDATDQRIADCDSGTLLRCADRVLTATSLSEVFDDLCCAPRT